jgi:ATP-dependent DNA helicase RecG
MLTAQQLVDTMRRERSDLPNVEAKSAAGGYPTSLGPTMSALSNLPGGGWIVLGVAEDHGFKPVPLGDTNTLRQTLASKARQGYDPPVAIEVTMDVVDGEPVILARIGETPPSAKPCRIRSTGDAYMRFWDGDYRLSDIEIQGFLANRTQPAFDRDVVPQATLNDLDPVLLQSLMLTARRSDTRLTRIADDNVLLQKLGVITMDGQITVAGLLAIGDYPQQWFPNFVIQAAVATDNTEADNVRFSGPIPVMLDEALAWIRQRGRERIVTDANGRVRSEVDYPSIAIRELLSNALVHRDLAPWSASRAIEIRLRPDRLVFTNPGGLFGVTLDRLGQEQLTSARNLSLVRLCQYVELQDGRVVEMLASGIPEVLRSIHDAGLPTPTFLDQGLRFTAILFRPKNDTTATLPDSTDSHTHQLTAAEARVLAAIPPSGATVAEIALLLDRSTSAVHKHLTSLRTAGLVAIIGGRGTPTTRYTTIKR